MRRLQLLELHEAPWFPPVWRNLFTEFLAHYAAVFRPYENIAGLLAEAIERNGATRLVDLAAGGGSTVLELKEALDLALGRPLTVVLTDKFPNHRAFAAVASRFPGQVEAVAEPIDAADVPVDLDGFRTLFSSFHHFDPATARKVLEDAVERGRAIAVFEYTERRPLLWIGPLLLTPLLIWGLTPLIRPFTWPRLVWTYVIPVIPVVAAWDLLVSVLRSYTPAELAEMAAGLDRDGYTWETGQTPSLGMSRVTYLLGVPATRRAPTGGSRDRHAAAGR